MRPAGCAVNRVARRKDHHYLSLNKSYETARAMSAGDIAYVFNTTVKMLAMGNGPRRATMPSQMLA